MKHNALNYNDEDTQQPDEAHYPKLANTIHIGTVICPVTGFERERAVCMETKHTARQRRKAKKPYCMSFLRVLWEK